MGFHWARAAAAMSGMRGVADVCAGAAGSKHLGLVYSAGWVPALRICVRAREWLFFAGDLGVQLWRGSRIGNHICAGDRSLFSAVALEAYRMRCGSDAGD